MTKRMIIGGLIGALAGVMFRPHIISVLLCAAAGVYFAKKYATREPSKVFEKYFSMKVDPIPEDATKSDDDTQKKKQG